MWRRLWLCVAFFGFVGVSRAADGMALSRQGVPGAVIVVPAAATAPERNAAAELKLYLDRLTGAEFAVVSESASEQVPAIHVGRTRRLAERFPEIDLDTLAPDSIVLKGVPDGTLVLAGAGERGTLYAVYTFLQDFCGVRWWTPEAEWVPPASDLTVPLPDVVYTPPLEYRDAFALVFNGMEPYFEDGARQRFAVRLKNNGFFNGIPAEWGGNDICLPGAWPVFSQLIPPDRYFADHPEWFSEIEGQRVPRQLCLSNVAMRREMAANLLALIRATPGVKHVTITQNDSGAADYCHCAECGAVDDAEGAPSGLLLRCVNAVAEEVEREFPHLYVNTLAYHYNLKAPRLTVPRHNVSLQICSPMDSADFDAPEQRDFVNSLAIWSRISPKLYAWTYWIDFGDVLNPIPNVYHLGPNLRLLVEYRTSGVFAQGNAYAPAGDFTELKAWLLARLMWDPTLDDRKLVREFLDGYYGAGGAALERYLLLLDAENDERKLILHNAYADPPALRPWLSLAAMNQATALLDEAAAAVAAAGQSAEAERVRQARLAIDFQWILGWEEYAQEARERRMEFKGPADRQAAFEQFMADCARWKIRRLCEGNGSLNILHAAIFRTPAPN